MRGWRSARARRTGFLFQQHIKFAADVGAFLAAAG